MTATRRGFSKKTEKHLEFTALLAARESDIERRLKARNNANLSKIAEKRPLNQRELQDLLIERTYKFMRMKERPLTREEALKIKTALEKKYGPMEFKV